MLNIDLSNVSESGLPPDGEYLIVVDEAVVKETKDGTGQYINARFKFLDGPSKGSTFYTMYNIKNKNEQAVKIGLGELKRLLKAGGRSADRLNSASELEGVTVSARIKIVTDDYGEKVKISKYTAGTVGSAGAASPF